MLNKNTAIPLWQWIFLMKCKIFNVKYGFDLAKQSSEVKNTASILLLKAACSY